MNLTDKVTDHFTFGELVATSHREFLPQQQNPPQKVVDNLKKGAVAILEPVRAMNGNDPIHVNDAYRCKGLNGAVGGAHNSQHECGEENGEEESAFDLCDYKNGNLHLFEMIRKSAIPFDQLITECPDKNAVPAWVHVSHNPRRNRRQVLRARITGYKDAAKTIPIFEYEDITHTV